MSNIQITTTKAAGELQRLLDGSRDQLSRAIPASVARHLTPDRVARIALTEFRKTPDLWKCDQRSIVGAVVQAPQLGLEVGAALGHAYLVPFWDKHANGHACQLIIGYKGFIALARRSGEVERFSAHVVHAGDEFTYEFGSTQRIHHRPVLAERGEPVAVYAQIMTERDIDFEVLGWDEVLAFRERFARKKGGDYTGPWATDLEEMAKKTAIRRLAKRAPLSVEFQKAAALDGMAEAGEPQNLADELDVPRESRASRLVERFKPAPEPCDPRQLERIRELVAELGLSNEEAADLEGQYADATGTLAAADARDIIDDLTARLARKAEPADA
jgi:recombination protein RecT